jgi:thiamine pyrophosphokinase
MANTTYLFLNGLFTPPPDFPTRAPSGSLVVAVDGGAKHCLKLGWKIDVLLGDFDSLAPKTISQIKRANPALEVFRYQADKDETDFELALSLIKQRPPKRLERLEVLGALGGRWDMTIANLTTPLAGSVLGRTEGLKILFRDARWDIFVLTGPISLKIPKAKILRRFSLIPLTPVISGVRLTGDFKYPLDGDDLLFGFTRGLSNELGLKGGCLSFEKGFLMLTVSPMDESINVLKSINTLKTNKAAK